MTNSLVSIGHDKGTHSSKSRFVDMHQQPEALLPGEHHMMVFPMSIRRHPVHGTAWHWTLSGNLRLEEVKLQCPIEFCCHAHGLRCGNLAATQHGFLSLGRCHLQVPKCDEALIGSPPGATKKKLQIFYDRCNLVGMLSVSTSKFLGPGPVFCFV